MGRSDAIISFKLTYYHVTLPYISDSYNMFYQKSLTVGVPKVNVSSPDFATFSTIFTNLNLFSAL